MILNKQATGENNELVRKKLWNAKPRAKSHDFSRFPAK